MERDMRQLTLFQKVESDGGPFFKVVLDPVWLKKMIGIFFYWTGLQVPCVHEITLYAIAIEEKRSKTPFLTLKNYFEKRPSIRLNFLKQQQLH